MQQLRDKSPPLVPGAPRPRLHLNPLTLNEDGTSAFWAWCPQVQSHTRIRGRGAADLAFDPVFDLALAPEVQRALLFLECEACGHAEPGAVPTWEELLAPQSREQLVPDDLVVVDDDHCTHDQPRARRLICGGVDPGGSPCCANGAIRPIPNIFDSCGRILAAELRGLLAELLQNTRRLLLELSLSASTQSITMVVSRRTLSRLYGLIATCRANPGHASLDHVTKIAVIAQRIEQRKLKLVDDHGRPRRRTERHGLDSDLLQAEAAALLAELDLIHTGMVLASEFVALTPSSDHIMYVAALGCHAEPRDARSNLVLGTEHAITIEGFAAHLDVEPEVLRLLLLENTLLPQLGPFCFRCFVPGCQGVVFTSAIACLPSRAQRAYLEQFLVKELEALADAGRPRPASADARAAPPLQRIRQLYPASMNGFNVACSEVLRAFGEGAVRRCPRPGCALPHIYLEGDDARCRCLACGWLWCYACGAALATEHELRDHRRPGNICPKKITSTTEGRTQRLWAKRRFREVREACEALDPGYYAAATQLIDHGEHRPLIMAFDLLGKIVGMHLLLLPGELEAL